MDNRRTDGPMSQTIGYMALDGPAITDDKSSTMGNNQLPSQGAPPPEVSK